MHHWQDIVIAIGSLVLAGALFPSLLSKNKPAVWTSILTGSVLVAFSFTYASLKLWYATVTTGLTAILWGILALQKVLQPKDD